MKNFIILLSVLVTMIIILGCDDDTTVNPVVVDSNPFRVVFNENIGGDNWEWGKDIVAIPSGGYIVTGWTDSYGTGRNDLYLIRLDNTGNMVWQKNFGGLNNNSDDHGESVILTNDGNILAVGGSNAFGTEYQHYIVKTDMDGNLVWEKTVSTNTYESKSKVFEVPNGYIIGGNRGVYPNEEYCALKIDLNGNILWDSTYSSSTESHFKSMTSTTDDGYILAGSYFLKIDSSGNEVWRNISYLSSSPDTDEIITSVINTSDGNYVASGGQTVPTANINDPYNLFMVKLNNSGVVLWQYQYDIPTFSGRSYVVENNDGSLSVIVSDSSDQALSIVNIDANGLLDTTLSTGLSGLPFEMIQGHSGYAVTGFNQELLPDSTYDEGSVLVLEFEPK